jgi:hypothetical protein
MRTSTSATHVCCRTVSPCNRNECRTCQVQPLPQPCCSRILLERTVREKRAWTASPALCLLALSEIPCLNAPSFVLDSSLYTWCRVGGCGPTLGAPLLGAQVNLPPTRHLKWSWSKSPAIRAFRSVLFGVVPWLPTRSLRRGSQPELVSWLRTRVRSSAGVRSTFPSAHRFGLLRQVPVRLGAAPRSVWALGQRATTPTLECVQRSKGAPRFLPACNRAPLSGLPCAEVLCGRLRWECAQARSTHPTHRSVSG